MLTRGKFLLVKYRLEQEKEDKRFGFEKLMLSHRLRLLFTLQLKKCSLFTKEPPQFYQLKIGNKSNTVCSIMKV